MASKDTIPTRSMVIALKAVGDKSTAKIAHLTGLSPRAINHIYSKAQARGFDPSQRPLVIKSEYVEDAPRSGRPSKQSSHLLGDMLSSIRYDEHGREKSYGVIAAELNAAGHKVSASTVWRMLKKPHAEGNEPGLPLDFSGPVNVTDFAAVPPGL